MFFICCVFFFKQKTAYEMRISDWSSDVCSSDLDRDEWGFNWLAQYFAQRGYAVMQPDYRGLAGYGEQWFRDGGFQSWRTAIGDVSDAGRWIVAEGADPAKLSIVGWGYGGYAALQSGVVAPSLFRSIVAIAPITDLQKLKEDSTKFSNNLVMQQLNG